MRILGGSIGIAASTAILGVETRARLDGLVGADQLGRLASQPSSLTPEQRTAVRETYTAAFQLDMIVCCAVLAFGTVCTMGVYRRNRVSIMEHQKRRYQDEWERRQGHEKAGHPAPSDSTV